MSKVDSVRKVLNNFLTEFGYDDVTADYIEISDSYYEPTIPTGKVVLGGMSNPEADKIFMRYCYSIGLEVKVSVETLSFLHELGHHNTMDILDDEEIYESEAIKMMLYMQDEETEENFMKYFTCPIEREATYNAVDFCNNNPTAVKKLDNELISTLY